MTPPAHVAALDVSPAADVADLTALARSMYPHDGLAEAPYERTARAILAQASSQPVLWHVLNDGLSELRIATGDALPAVAPEVLRALLTARIDSELFRSLRPLVAWHLYDDHEVWEFIGYPGSSFDKGGYLHRGFDDLKWLPHPRVEESREPLAPTGPLPYALGESR